MSLPKGPYNPKQTEEKILDFWLKHKFYKPEYSGEADRLLTEEELKTDRRETFSIVLPPPNANGNLHLGHMSGYLYQDLMGRYNRMQGKKVLLLPGKDHAGIQSEVVFERELEKRGTSKQEIGREEFYRQCYEFCIENGKIARQQEMNIGLSADFDRELFTLDPKIVNEILTAFELMYNDDLIYRGKRLINWCVRCQSALADIDTEFKDSKSSFFYFKYGFSIPEEDAIKIKNKFAGQTIRWKYERSKSSKGEDLPFAIGELADSYKIQTGELKINAIGYDDLTTGEEYTGQTYGILMRLDNNFRLVIVNPEFAGDIQAEITKLFLFEIAKVGGAHVIPFSDYPDDKFYNNGFILGTVRPETKFGDTAIAADPEDKRYAEFVGKEFEVITLNGSAKINFIADKDVDMNFGTGLVKVTPAHAPEDWDIAQRHPEKTMPERQVIDFDGKLNHLTEKYEGMSVNKARREMAKDMKEIGMLVYLDENYENRIRICERCKSRIEPLISYQWFVDTAPLKQKAKELVEEGVTEILPEGKKKVYLDWMNSPEDWCITRQLWWGYRLPVWYKGGREQIVDEIGQVQEKIGGKLITMPEDYKDVMYVGLEDPNEISDLRSKTKDKQDSYIFVPGKHEYAERKLFSELISKIENSQYLTIQNISKPTYKDYEKALMTIPISEATTFVCHSLAAPAILDYLVKNKLAVRNLILIAPSTSASKSFDKFKRDGFWSEAGSYENYEFAQEIKLICSADDETQTLEGFKKLAELIGAELIEEKSKQHYAGEDYDNDSPELESLLKSYVLNLQSSEEWVRDEDVLDTWFSSGQWPYATLMAKEGDYETFYPTQVMETGWDILIFWVTRMMLLNPYRAGKQVGPSRALVATNANLKPFEIVYLHGLVLDKHGTKMSKSKGNGIDPFEMMQKYGTDALRFSFVVGNAAGQNYRLYEEKINSYAKFCNKIWNATRFVMMNLNGVEAAEYGKRITEKFSLESNQKLVDHVQKTKQEVTHLIDTFQFGVAAQVLYQEFWHSFCDVHIEAAKPHTWTQKDKKTGEVISEPDPEAKAETQIALLYAIREYMKMLHPFIPFITEEIWSHLPKVKGDKKSLMYQPW